MKDSSRKSLGLIFPNALLGKEFLHKLLRNQAWYYSSENPFIENQLELLWFAKVDFRESWVDQACGGAGGRQAGSGLTQFLVFAQSTSIPHDATRYFAMHTLQSLKNPPGPSSACKRLSPNVLSLCRSPSFGIPSTSTVHHASRKFCLKLALLYVLGSAYPQFGNEPLLDSCTFTS